MFVTPAPGLRIPDPDLRDHLPEEGREVTDAPYWQRRIFDGDVVVTTPPQEPAAIAKRSEAA